MMNDKTVTEKLAGMISLRMERGFIPDADTMHFLRTSCGVDDEDDLKRFMNDNSLNDGTIYELIIYPDPDFRLDIERELPAGGVSGPLIKTISENVISMDPHVFIIIPGEKFEPRDVDRKSAICSFIKKLNLETDLLYLGEREKALSESLYFRMRSLMRRKKFIPSGDRGEFMRRLLCNNSVIRTEDDELMNIAENAISLLSGTEEKVFDALTVKKYYYESVVSQNEEFASLLKTWGMEFLMMRRIQPPPVSADEAIKMIMTIDHIASMVYGLIIPSSDMAVQMTINGGDRIPDIFG